MREFIIAYNPDAESRLRYLLELPVNDGTIWLKTNMLWPRRFRTYCHPLESPPKRPEVVERTLVIACERRGRAIDLVLDRKQNRRSQFIKVEWRGRPLIFWQSATSAREARPSLRIPHGRTPDDVVIYFDSNERYGYSFKAQHATTQRWTLPVGDYAVMADNEAIAVVERKRCEDFITTLIDGSLMFAMAELASVPVAAVVVEGTYSRVLRHAYSRPGWTANLLSHLTVRYPNVSINFVETHRLAEEWTYRFLVAAYAAHHDLSLNI